MCSERFISTHIYASPFGPLILGAVDRQLCLCYWQESPRCLEESLWLEKRLQMPMRAQYDAVFQQAVLLLEHYFAGNWSDFELPLLLVGTPFQQDVWTTLSHVSYGTTVSYMKLAQMVGRPNAVRAVAAALPYNPLQVILPCHRVVGTKGKLTGYAGGLILKRRLLELEHGASYPIF